MRDTVGERIRLSRTGPGDHEERGAGRTCRLLDTLFDGSSLFRIELFEIGDGHRLRIVQEVLFERSMFPFRSQRATETASNAGASAPRGYRRVRAGRSDRGEERRGTAMGNETGRVIEGAGENLMDVLSA